MLPAGCWILAALGSKNHYGTQRMNKVASVPAVFRKTADTFAAAAKTLPQQYFVSDEIFRQEQEQLFSKQWILVGHQSQIVRNGDYFVAEVNRESLIVIRDKNGRIHGFFNVCRHRGTRLKEDACGHASAIQCPYHAWTYRLDGRLIGAPHMDEVPGFDKADYSLRAVNLALWEGFCPHWRCASVSPSGREAGEAEEEGNRGRRQRLQIIGRMVRAVEREVFALEHVDLAPGKTDRVRRAGQLEADVRELFGVLSLSGRAPDAGESLAI